MTAGDTPPSRPGIRGSTADQIVSADIDRVLERCGSSLTEMEDATVVITGGGGFLGHYLVRSLLAWNHDGARRPITVVVADNWMRGLPDWLAPYRTDEHLQVETLDITRPWPDDLPLGEWIVHAASIASPHFYRQFPIETMDANVNGLRNLLDALLATGSPQDLVRGLLFFSSSEVYGNPHPDAIPTPESYNGDVSCTGPRACYDESKRYGETICANFVRVHSLPITTVRPFNNYGPGLAITDRRVIPDFARDILAGHDITMFSDGAPSRTFCYVADAVVGYLTALVRGGRGEAYNIGADEPEVSVRELAERMAAIARTELGYPGTVITATSEDPDYLVDNPDRRCPDITKARTELGFAPEVDLDDGLSRALRWYRSTDEEN